MFRLFGVLLGLVFFPFLLSAQQDVDSLEAVLAATPAGIERVDALNDLVALLRERDNNKALQLAKESLDLAEGLQYDKGIARALENLGWVYYRRGIFAEAFELSHHALKKYEEQLDQSGVARCLNNVAAISYESKKYDEAVQSFTRAYRIASEQLEFTTAVRSLNNISFSYLAMNNLDSADRYARLALSESVIHRFGYMSAFSFRTLGDVALAKGNPAKAMDYFQQALKISRDNNNFFIQSSTLHRIGKTHFQVGAFDDALAVLNENLMMAQKNGYSDELERTYQLVADIYHANGDDRKAYEFQKKYSSLHDSLNYERYNDRVTLLQGQFELDLKEAQIELLTKNAQIQQEEIKQQRVWTYFYVGCLTLVILVVMALYYSYTKIKKTKAALTHINAAKDKLLSVISHDIRSPLASLKGMLNVVSAGNLTQDEFTTLSRQIGHHLDSVYEDVGTVLQWAKSQLLGMNVDAKVFELRPLVTEVAMLFSETARAKGIVVRNEVKPNITVEADPNHIKIALRNLIANAIKFSPKKSEVVVTNQVHHPMVNVEVIDKGIGVSREDMARLFNPGSLFTRPGTANEKGMGVGLLLTKEFIEKNGGSMAVESEVGKGSKFSFTLRTAS